MAEERIAERIDANLMNVTMDTLKEMPKTSYEKKIGKLREKIKGKLTHENPGAMSACFLQGYIQEK